MKALLFVLILVASVLTVNAQTIHTMEITFACNSSVLTTDQQARLASITGTITLIEGSASIEGDAAKNEILASNRAYSVANFLNSLAPIISTGATTKHGKTLSANRVVIVTYTQPELNSNIEFNTTIENNTTAKNDIEGYNCGKTDFDFSTIDTTNMPFDTIVIAKTNDTTVTTANLELPILDAPVVTPVDTMFLPTTQAIRFYMKKGKSRKEATKIVVGRKDQWKQIKKKSTKKRMPKKTMGKNNTLLSKLFPFRGC